MSSNASPIVRRAGMFLALALAAAGCTVDKSSVPPVSAPSGFALSLTSSASPDVLPRDGVATSNLRFVVHDYKDKPVVGQRLLITANTGTLSASDVTTDSAGFATVRFTAPSISTPVSSATVVVTPVGSDLGTVISDPSTILIALNGPSVPQAAFTWSPSTPSQFGVVSFDATATTLSGTSCLDVCSYSWNFGDGSTGSGRLASHAFNTTGSVSVVLTVTSPAGVVVTSTRTLVVGTAAPITAVITQSPTNAKVGDVVIFDASSSSTPDGTAITSWAWDFGCSAPSSCNVSTATTKQATVTFSATRTYTVRLTITDALGRTATTTTAVSIN